MIRREGPIPFDRFMEMALYDPDGGYFGSGPLRSRAEGDFLTSPETSGEFGATLARFVEKEFRRLGRPAGFTLLEVGAGSGTLLSPLLGALDWAPRTVAVEVSPAARQTLRQALPGVEVVADDRALDPFSGVVIANEVLDNLPVAVAVRTGDGGWAERRVWCEGADLVLVEAPVRSDVLAWLEAHAADVPAGGVVECQPAASNWMGRMIDLLDAGAVVVIDYGDTSEGLLPRRRRGGTLRTYRAHHLSQHPLDEPGSMDITADVDFSALAAVAAARGMRYRLYRQDDFLSELGLDGRRAELRQRELAEARGGDPMERLRLRSRVKEIETLLHPRGFGDFRVLVATR
ncbi:SAM-dependent methyltransferase [Candidatus Spongiisocius sp.]|uniref:SAM-dependent methyltransferase n=1 Tax=Candidatus Spongiisocius sp. TaxID=3101273 RepID=UPI003B5CE91D